jgi:fumarylpyruvate hydrolase
MLYAIPEPARISLPIAGSGARFPVRRIYCVGRNYAAHAVEMGHDPNKEPPFFFQKSPEHLVTDGAAMPYPPATTDLHHEVEMAVALSGGGRDLTLEHAQALVFGQAVALDMTRRDIQAQLKTAARPWEAAKSFAASAPCGPLVPVAQTGVLQSGVITLHVNGALRQSGDIAQMIWKTAEIIVELSRLFDIGAGDLILTGTPAGVGSVQPGDRMQARIDGLGVLDVAVVRG